MGLESLDMDVLYEIFSHLTDIQIRAHPHHYPARPPAFPLVHRRGIKHPYMAISRVSRSLNRDIEAYCKHKLAIVGITKSASTNRKALLHAAYVPRCHFCLASIGPQSVSVHLCSRCNYMHMGDAMSGYEAMVVYHLPGRILLDRCIPVLLEDCGVEDLFFLETDVLAAAKATVGELVLTSVLIAEFRARIALNDRLLANLDKAIGAGSSGLDETKLHLYLLKKKQRGSLVAKLKWLRELVDRGAVKGSI